MITFLADKTSIGDGINIDTMDLHFSNKHPWLSLVIPELKKRNYQVEILYWDDKTIDWTIKKLVIIGPIWDYYEKVDRFLKFLDKLEESKTKVINSIKLLKLNVNKNYLKIFANSDYLINTRFINKENKETLSDIVNKHFKNEKENYY